MSFPAVSDDCIPRVLSSCYLFRTVSDALTVSLLGGIFPPLNSLSGGGQQQHFIFALEIITCYKFYISYRLIVEKSARYLIVVKTNRVKYHGLGSVRTILTVCCRRIHQHNTRTTDMTEN